jgi:S-adenosyl-L-methionine hydrolase (adenosine-forming)
VFVTFLTDFGLEDDFVGVCHGVIKRIAPDAEVVDITHGIAPHAVLQGALALANTLPYMPDGVHLAVVDPGVGGARRALALRSGSGRYFVGPDNGLLVPAADRMGGIVAVHELTNPSYMLEPVSRTFHARDVFAPAAAHIASGVQLSEFGPPVDPELLVRIDLAEPDIGTARIRATVIAVDRFGNVQLNLERADVERVGIEPGLKIELELGFDRYYAVAARTFADARKGEIVLYEDSYRNVSVAINGGNAASMFGVEPGSEVRIRIAG